MTSWARQRQISPTLRQKFRQKSSHRHPPKGAANLAPQPSASHPRPFADRLAQHKAPQSIGTIRAQPPWRQLVAAEGRPRLPKNWSLFLALLNYNTYNTQIRLSTKGSENFSRILRGQGDLKRVCKFLTNFRRTAVEFETPFLKEVALLLCNNLPHIAQCALTHRNCGSV